MSDDLKYEVKSNREHARNVEHKFNYFFVSLTFSVLALAINHGVETDLRAPLISGLMGWLLLLISGVFGVLRLEDQPTYFRILSLLAEIDVEKEAQTQKQGLVKSPYSSEYGDEIKYWGKELDSIDSRLRWKYFAQKWGFLSGVVLLTISYSYPLICALFQKAPVINAALVYLSTIDLYPH